MSSGSVFGQSQSKSQQKCINALNKSGAKVSGTQGKVNTACIAAGGKGEDPSPQVCLTRDTNGELAKATAKVQADFDKKCSSATPDFGVPGAPGAVSGIPSAVSRAGSEDSLALVGDIFGKSLDDAIVKTKAGAGCQAAVSKAYEKTFAAYMKGFAKCAKDVLKGGGSEADLEACVLDDSSGKAAKAASKLSAIITAKCEQTGNIFPACSGATVAELPECITKRVRYRVCRTQNAMDGLSADCPHPKRIEEVGRCADYDPLKRAYFGETHIHTNRSLDSIALVGSTQLSASRVLNPEQSYRYAKGEPVEIPVSLEGPETETITIERPLHFAMIADHAEYLGVAGLCGDPNEAAYDETLCYNVRVPEDAPQTGGVTGGGSGPFFAYTSGYAYERHPICGENGEDCLPYADDVWTEIQQASEVMYDRTDACTFTTLVGYEWTLTPLGDNLHRNVVFRNDVVPARPLSVVEAKTPPALWQALRDECIDTASDCDAFAIPHNSNRSAGRQFANDQNLTTVFGAEPVATIDAEYALERQSMEPLNEMYQYKGSSECNIELSADEECGFDAGAVRGFVGATTPPVPESFARNALGLGLEHLENLGVNPFKFGMIAATDSHDGRAGGALYDEIYAAQRVTQGSVRNNEMANNSGGIAGVWATENSRESIFDAMRSKETFGTSGPRILPRFFGSWGFPATACEDPVAAIQNAYEVGVPMGGDLPEAPAPGTAPQFLVMAEADVDAPVRGTVPLTAIQIVKVERENGEYREQVFTVAGEVAETHTVDPVTCESTAPQDAPLELCAVWTDPDFDPSEHAVYYARVLEHSTCRHSTLVCNEVGFDCENQTTSYDEVCCNPRFGFDNSLCEPDPPDCSNPSSVPTSQRACCLPAVEPLSRHRAWTSPIWYSASAGGTP